MQKQIVKEKQNCVMGLEGLANREQKIISFNKIKERYLEQD